MARDIGRCPLASGLYLCVNFIAIISVAFCPGVQCEFYANVSESALLTFQHSSGPSSFYIMSPSDAWLLYLSSYGDSSMNKRFSFAGDLRRNNITMLVSNVSRDDAGTYYCAGPRPTFKIAGCEAKLVVLDRPTRPLVRLSKVPVVGEDVELTCVSRSTTVPAGSSLGLSYTWKRDGVEIANASDSTFIIHNVTKYDLGATISCLSEEKRGMLSHESFAIPLPVKCVHEPAKPSITIAEPDSNATFNFSLPPSLQSDMFFVINTSCYSVLSMRKDGAAQTRVSSAYVNRVSITHSGEGEVVFSLGNVTTSDAGFYGCGDGNTDATVENCGQKLIVLRVPSKPNITSSEIPYVGLPVVLQCTSHSTSLPPDGDLEMTFTWFKNGQVLGPPSVNDIHEVKDISKESSGDVYTCTAHEKRGLQSPQSDPFVMMPEYSPNNVTFNVVNASVNVVEKDLNIMTVQCSADCRPNCTYAWSKDGRALSQGAVYGLVNMTRAQTGMYACKATNKHGTFTGEIFVNVLYPAKILTYSLNKKVGSVQVKENDTVTLHCTVEGNPPPVIHFVNGSDVIRTDAHALRADLSWRHAACLDAGLYTCDANNQVGSEVFRTVQLRVICKPRVDRRQPPSAVVFVPLGKPARLQAHFLAFPWPRFQWFRSRDNTSVLVNHSHLHQVDQVQVTTLVFSAVAVEDYGLYHVNATNSLGTAQSSLRLVRADPPEQPTGFFCLGRTSSSLRVQWTAQSDHGSPQTFTLRYFQKGFSTLPAVQENIPDPGDGNIVTFNLSSLAVDTMYHLQVTAKNKWGSTARTEITCFTAEGPSKGFTLSFAEGLGIGLAVCFIVILAITAFLCRNRIKQYQKRKKQAVILEHIYQDLSDQPMGEHMDEDAGSLYSSLGRSSSSPNLL